VLTEEYRRARSTVSSALFASLVHHPSGCSSMFALTLYMTLCLSVSFPCASVSPLAVCVSLSHITHVLLHPLPAPPPPSPPFCHVFSLFCPALLRLLPSLATPKA
jgi:hypothetical protein